MAYTSDKIVSVVNRLNTQYFLPAIQREFVWQPEQIVELFDSILRRYPIGSFLYWRLDDANKESWEVYKFVDSGKHGGVRNTKANTMGVRDLTMILDGQQRLTSLLIGLKGSYLVKKRYYHWDNPRAWETQYLHIDLFDDPITTDDGAGGVYYGLRFLPETPEPDEHHYWFRVGRILDFHSEAAYEAFREAELEKMPDAVTRKQMNLFQKNLDRLYRVIWVEDVIAYYTEQQQDYDRVLDIFVRANEGGTKLSKSDLLLSMVTAKWTTVDAREEIFQLVERLNNELDRKNNLDKDFVMKTCLVVAELPVAYQVNNFTNQNLSLIEKAWPDIKDAIERAVRLVNSFGIDRDTLLSANALIPIVYYMYHHKGKTFLGESHEDVINALRIRQWFVMALLNNVFSGASDNALRDTRNALRDAKGDIQFPTDELNAALAQSGRSAAFNDAAIANFLDIRFGERRTFLALSLLYDDQHWSTGQHHQDHIIPRSLFTPERMSAAELTEDQQIRYRTLVDRVGNLQLLSAAENMEKSDKPFDQWLTTRHETAMHRHLIPEDATLYTFERFEEFVSARETLIRQRLQSMFEPTIATRV